MAIKDHVEGIRKSFFGQIPPFYRREKEEFLAQNNEEGLDFEYHFPLKISLMALTRLQSKQRKHFKQLQNNLEQNFAVRESLIEELKT